MAHKKYFDARVMYKSAGCLIANEYISVTVLYSKISYS